MILFAGVYVHFAQFIMNSVTFVKRIVCTWPGLLCCVYIYHRTMYNVYTRYTYIHVVCRVTFGEPIVYMAGVRALRHRRPKLRPRFAHITLTDCWPAHIITSTAAKNSDWCSNQWECSQSEKLTPCSDSVSVIQSPKWHPNRPDLVWFHSQLLQHVCLLQPNFHLWL